LLWLALAAVPRLAAGNRGKSPLPKPVGGGSLLSVVAGDLVRRLRREGDGGRCARGGASPSSDEVRQAGVTMAERSYSLSEESMRLAEEGVLLIMSATYGAALASFVVMEATFHVLAAWAASSPTTSSSTERNGDVEGSLPSSFAYDRAPQWLPVPHRTDD
jgi:hypothetical protein